MVAFRRGFRGRPRDIGPKGQWGKYFYATEVSHPSERALPRLHQMGYRPQTAPFLNGTP